MAFAPGDRVHVAMLGTGVVREVRNGGRYLVELKGRSVVVAERQMAPAAATRRHGRPAAAAPVDDDAETGTSPRSIDLHGMTAADAAEALDAFLSTALLEGARQVRVIHGRSGGRLRGAVHARLEQVPAVRGFSIDPRNPGVTIVRFS
jgi:DNA mismatch repair protein MutS2